jgi:hypothetical protein
MCGVLMKNCPMCRKELVYDEDEDGSACPTLADPQVWGAPHSHFYFYPDGLGLLNIKREPTERLFVSHYQMITDENGYGIFNNNKGWARVGVIPKFQITSAEQVLHKIRTVVVFS